MGRLEHWLGGYEEVDKEEVASPQLWEKSGSPYGVTAKQMMMRVETAAKEKNGEKNEKMSHTRNSQVEPIKLAFHQSHTQGQNEPNEKKNEESINIVVLHQTSYFC
ncbi:hypothetical protein J5N97_020616 [Dioscorea zingiberensis]|uniref:Uncharacterized protein n=1 Tax=Dioscorea zingiberensis TaxID=325984 RepID=A0A9D5CHE1_9LILI|nr:hypothetical protein J5N97_020616 [Dioscorea zingiberensis]